MLAAMDASRFFFLLLILCMTLGAQAESGQVQAAMSIDRVVQLYGALPRTSKMRVSPNGKLIAFLKSTPDSSSVLVYSLEEKKVVSGANVSEIRPHQIYFMDDDHLILVASEHRRVMGFRGRFDVSTAFALNTKSGDINQLLRPGEGIYAGQTGLGGVVGTSENNRYIYMPAFVAESATDLSPDFSLMRVKVSSPRRPKQWVKGDKDTIDYFMDGEGNVVAQEQFENHNNRHLIKVPAERGWKTIFSQNTAIKDVEFVGLTPDYQSLVMINENPATGRIGYFTVSLADGKVSQQPLGRQDADVDHVLMDINRVVHGLVYAGFTPDYELFDAGHQSRVEAMIKQFPNEMVSLIDWSPDWKHLVFKVEGLSSAGSFYLASEGGEPRFLANAYPDISPEIIQPTAVYAFQASDGMTIPTLLTLSLSQAENPQRMATVILPHGGPASYDRKGFDWLAQALAARGYLVLQPQFRGSTGFGVEHYLAGQGQWGRKMQDDLTEAVHYFAKGGLVDPERVCILGASYGGYAALAGAAFTPELYACAVSINGVADVKRMLKDERSARGKDHWVVAYFEQSAVAKDYSDDDLRAISPYYAADNVQAPVLLIHGEEDEVVPIQHSIEMEDALSDADKLVRFVTLKNENHYLMEGATRQQALHEILRFIEPYLAE